MKSIAIFVLRLMKKTFLTISNAWHIFESEFSYLIQNVVILRENEIIN